jgi:hypothetical protein
LRARLDPANPVPSPYYSLSAELLKLAQKRNEEQAQRGA